MEVFDLTEGTSEVYAEDSIVGGSKSGVYVREILPNIVKNSSYSLQANEYAIGHCSVLKSKIERLSLDKITSMFDDEDCFIIFNNTDCENRSGDGLRTQRRLVGNLRTFRLLLRLAVRDARKKGWLLRQHHILKPVMLCSEAGCQQQAFHRDLPLEIVNGEKVTPLSVLVPLVKDSTLCFGKTSMNPILHPGDYLLFGSRVVHAGAPNSTLTTNFRLHSYLGRPDLTIGDITDDNVDLDDLPLLRT